MTAISAILTKDIIAISSDSLLTRYYKSVNRYEEIEHQKSKIILMEKYRAAASYWGLAKYGNEWTLGSFIRQRLEDAPRGETLKEFVERLRLALQKEIKGFKFRRNLDSGIGIHITGFENIDGMDLPELYLLTNFDTPTCDSLKPKFIGLPQVYSTIKNNLELPETQQNQERNIINTYLSSSEWHFLNFNNGDPIIYNSYSKAVIQSMMVLHQRFNIRMNKPEFIRAIARRPIEGIKMAQRDFMKHGQRVVGGKIHDILIHRDGTFS